ncbi:MAG: hypothetical protein H8E37_03745 [Planctomycetes bacterium]|nr:hypothetical protein [Planctomycetota bacterium]
MLAAKADYEAGQATIGTKPGTVLPSDEIISALKSIGYDGKLVKAAL